MTGHLASRTVLKKVDQLRELNIGSNVSLPQLVVVGDQSSGKSSLLESLTGIAFPTNAELCTRYVTQFTCRRDSEPRVEVSLIAGPSASPERKASLAAFRPPPLTPDEFRRRFSEILDQVNAHLGIRMDINDTSTTGAVFTDDVLKIEICSPDEDYLTIIDVPGIFRTAHGPTTDQDIALVRRMVESHIRDPRTIILAVLPANVDFATQEILALAEKHDPAGERTLGVLTKPDLLLESSAKQAVCNVVLGKRKPLRLGYYLVCNRGPDGDDRGIENRELMFSDAPWNTLPRERLGRDALKATLSTLLASLTKSVFGSLRQEIQGELEKTQGHLDAMGEPCETENQQRMFLSSIAVKFQALVTAARLGHYSQDDAFEKDTDLRLCTNVVNLADQLVREFSEMGHAYWFEDEEEEEIKAESIPRPVPVPRKGRRLSLDSDSDVVSEPIIPVSITPSSDCAAAPFDSDISGLIHDLPDCGPPRPGIKNWIADLNKRYRGPELIAPGPAILSCAFKEQSVRWDDIARYFVSSCIRAVHSFVRHALALLCPSPTLANELWDSISDEVLLRYKASLEQAAYIARIERCQIPYTLNQLFSAEVVKRRSARLCTKLQAIETPSVPQYKNTLAIDINTLHHLGEHEANSSYSNQEIHDALRAYYKIAADRFRDNLYMQAVSHGLMSGEKTPLGVFNPDWVLGLGAGELEGLVGDSPRTRARRTELEGRKGDLEKAVAILKG